MVFDVRRVVLTLGALLAPALGAAQPAGVPEAPFSLEYEPLPGCPTREAFLEEIQARVADLDAQSSLGARFRAELRAEDGLVAGKLSVSLADGSASERDIPPSLCADATRSMAIVIAMVLSGQIVADPSGPDDTTGAAPKASPPRDRAAPAPLAEPHGADADATPAADAPASAAVSQSSPLRLRWGAFANGELDFAVAPFPALGANAGLEVLAERTSPLAPSLRVGFRYVAGSANVPEFGDATFVLRALLVRACPLRFVLKSRAIHACALFDAGELHASGNTTDGTEAEMTWLAAGGAVRLEQALAPWFGLTLEGGVYGLVRHDRFVFEPGPVEAHDIPAVSGTLSIGVVARLP